MGEGRAAWSVRDCSWNAEMLLAMLLPVVGALHIYKQGDLAKSLLWTLYGVTKNCAPLWL
jgi:hypothetical protein